MDFEAVQVADNQERRVLKRFAVKLKLPEGRLQVAVFALVLPAELALAPDIRSALAALRGIDALLERIPGTGRVHVTRLRLIEEGTQIGEVRLTGRPLGKIGHLPASDELVRSHGRSLVGGVRASG